MKTSDAGLNVIKKSEGLRLIAYPDPATKAEPYTIGYGLTSASGVIDVKPGMKITQAEANRLLKEALAKYEAVVNSCLKRTPTQAQFDAMVSLCYNIGPRNFRNSTVVRKFNAGDFTGAAEAFMLFTKANGQTMKGLVNRRNEERLLFLIGSGQHEEPDPIPPKKIDPEAITVQPKPIAQHRRVWASAAGWVSGGGVATFASFSGFDWRTLAVLLVALAAFILFFWAIYKKEIEQGLFRP